jgi:methyltransferase
VRPGRYALILFGFGLQRLAELAYSLRNEARLRQRTPDAPHAAASTFRWMVAANVALFTLPAIEVAIRRARVPRIVSALGWVGALSAAAVRLSVVRALREQWTVRAVVPASLRVVDHGPYRYVRHPNYAAVALEFASLPLLGGAYLCAAGLSLANALLLFHRIADEERLLAAVPGYAERMAGKPRFLPRLRPLTIRPAARPTREASPGRSRSSHS